jgi:hypothetical protein
MTPMNEGGYGARLVMQIEGIADLMDASEWDRARLALTLLATEAAVQGRLAVATTALITADLLQGVVYDRVLGAALIDLAAAVRQSLAWG